MANDRSNFFFNVNILVALTRESGDGPCFLYIKFSWIGVLIFNYGDSYVEVCQSDQKMRSWADEQLYV